MKGHNYARDHAQIARKARPLGQFIVDQIHVRTSGPPRVPGPPRVGTQQGIQQLPEKRTPRTIPGRSDREAPVLHDCLRWLHRHGIFAWRVNTGLAWIGGRPISFGSPGSADITGILPDGRRLEIECKSPTGRQSEKQIKFQQKIEANHGVYLLARSEEELEEQWTHRQLSTSLTI